MPNATLLNTRPATQAIVLAELLQINGFESLFCPSLAIKPLTTPTPSLADFQYFFFVSAHAVEHFAKACQANGIDYLPLLQKANCFAIGKATAKALDAIGVEAQTPNKQFDTPSLLATLSEDLLHSVSCLVVKGKNGLPDLTDGLIQKGAKVSEWLVYQRVSTAFCEHAWQSFKQAKHPVVLASSLQAWVELFTKVSALKDEAWLLQQDTLVFSDRIADALITHGVEGKIVAVDVQSNQGIVDSLKTW